jgi:hypothetical protein
LISTRPISPNAPNVPAWTPSAAASNTMEQGPVDLELGWPGDYGDPRRELRIRVQRGAMAVHRAR